MTSEQSDLGSALDQLADLRDRLDRALVAAESHQAARGRAVNATQDACSCLEVDRDTFMRLGMLDDAARVESCIKRLQERTRG
jgi:hypothetical protein